MAETEDRQQLFDGPDGEPARPELAAKQPVDSPSPIDLPGCKPIPMTRAEYVSYTRRLELWDAAAKTAWVLRDGSHQWHEVPSQRLTQMATLIGAVRGRSIVADGSRGLARGGQDRKERIPHADQVVFLDASRLRVRPGDNVLLMTGQSYPDVVLEVDHTTDVRRGKLRLYESLGVPELWVETPDVSAPSRPSALKPGLTIYLLRQGRYATAPASQAFPSWTAADIHRAMNEDAFPSHRTQAILERLGREMGAREGTGPDDFPLMHSLRRESHDEGHAQGHAQGLAEGRAALAQAQAQAARRILRSRGIEVAEGFPADVAGFAELSMDEVLELALASTGEEDFRNRLRSR